VTNDHSMDGFDRFKGLHL